MTDEIRLRIAKAKDAKIYKYFREGSRPFITFLKVDENVYSPCETSEVSFDCSIPEYTTNIAAAWELVEEAEREGCGYTMSDCHHSDGRITHDFAFFDPVGGPVAHKYCADDAETVPIAICEAWLKREEGKHE